MIIPFSTRTLGILAALVLPLAATPEVAITINPNQARQTITMMGGDMERSSMFLTEAGNPSEVAGWAFKDIAFNVCRVQYDKHQELTEGKPDFPWYAKQVEAMKLVRQANPKILFYATLRSDYNGYKMGDSNNFPDWVWTKASGRFHADKWGGFLADFVIYMYRSGVPIRYLSTGKEITQIIDAKLAIASAEAMFAKLDAAKVPRPELVDPGAWSLPQGCEFIKQVEGLGKQRMFHAYASHNYRHQGEPEWRAFCKAAGHAGAEAWNAESSLGSGDIGATDPPLAKAVANMADRIQQYRAGIHGEIFFEIWSRGISRESRAIWFKRGEPAKRLRSYYLMRAWTNSVIGRTVLETTRSGPPGVEALAFRQGREMTIWLTNSDSKQAVDVSLATSNSKRIALVSFIRWTDDLPITGAKQAWQADDKGRLTLELPPNSLTLAIATLAP